MLKNKYFIPYYIFTIILSAIPFIGNTQNTANILKDTLLARQYLQGAAILLDSSLLDSAFTKTKEGVRINTHHSTNLDLEAANLLENIGMAFFRTRNLPLVIESFTNALDVYAYTSLAKSVKVAKIHNNLGIALRNEWRLKEALFHFNECLKMRLDIQGEKNIDVAKTYNNIGVVLSDMGKNGDALDSYEQSLRIKKMLPDADSLDIANTYLNIGGIYMELKNTVSAMKYNDQVMKIIQVTTQKDTRELASKLYNNIAGIYTYRRDYYQSLRYHEKSLELKLAFYGENNKETAKAYDNLAAVCMEMKNYREAIKLNKKALGIVKKVTGDSSVDVGLTYYRLGSIYGTSDSLKSAVFYLNEAVRLLIPAVTEEHIYVAECYSSLASVYEQQYAFDKALSYYEKSLAIFNKIAEGKISLDILRIYVNMGLVHKNAGHYSQAIEAFDWVIRHQEKGDKDNPETKFIYFEALLFKAELLSQIGKTVIDESTALHLFEKALEIGEDFRDNLEESYSKVKFLSLIKRVAEGLIRLQVKGLESSDSTKQQAFIIAEKSKSFLLKEGFRESHALAFSGLSDSLRLVETTLRQAISYNEKQYYLERNEPVRNDSLVNVYNNRIIELKKSYSGLKNYLEKNHESYYNLRYNRQIQTVASLQQRDFLLSPNQSLLEYFVGDSSVFIFLIQPNHYEVQEVKKDARFAQWIREMTKEGIYGNYALPKSRQGLKLKEKTLRNYANAAHQLYKILIAPIETKLTNEVIIIPDGLLGYVPFEALLTKKVTDPISLDSFKYLIQERQISYCYSATLLQEMREREHRQQPTEPFLAFAPSFPADIAVAASQKSLQKSTGLLNARNPLKYNVKEAQALQDIMGGVIHINERATKKCFVEESKGGRILHLSTHGVANDSMGDYSYLRFYELRDSLGNELLYVRDLYNLELNADLVTLSACETGIGELQSGEGIVSLARAFAYAGAKSIVTTLWSVKEKETMELMVTFYEYLHGGKTKDEALCLAKREFIKKNKANIELLHPFFWAGFIGVGDMRAIK